jgi:hypothetical protein
MHIVIEGVPCEMPQEATLTLDEAMLITEYSGLTLDQIEDNNAHPGVIKAMVHIAVARARPDMPKAEISRVVGELKLTDLAAAAEEVDARPPEEAPVSVTGNGDADAHGGGPSSPDGEVFPAQWSHDPSGLPV